MARMTDVGRRVMEVVSRSPGCNLDEVMKECPDLTWNQVFLEVDRLSRDGYVTLKLEQRGRYSVRPVERVVRPS
jgi:hypothetical protein